MQRPKRIFSQKKVFVLFITCLCSASLSVANVNDSLLYLLDNAPLEKKPQLYNRLYWESLYTNSQRALTYAEEGLKLARLLEDKRGEHGLLICIANYYRLHKQHRVGIKYILNSLRLARKLGALEMALSEQALGEAYAEVNNMQLGLEYLESAISRVENLDAHWFKAKSYYQISKMYFKEDRLQLAEMYSLKSLQYFNFMHNVHSIGWVHEMLAKIYQKNGNIELAEKHIKQAILFFENRTHYEGLLQIYKIYGKLANDQGDYPQALAYYDKAAAYLMQMGEHPAKEAMLLLDLATIQFENNYYKEALINAHQAMSLSKDLAMNDTYLQTLQIIANINFEVGEQDSAFLYLNKGLSGVGEMERNNAATERENLGLVYQMETQTMEVEMRQQESKIVRQLQMKKFLVVLIILCAIIIWILISANRRGRVYSKKLVQSSREIEEHKNALIQANHQLNEKNETLQQINEEKENTIRVVTHDLKAPLNRIAGLLQLLKLSLSRIDTEQKEYFRMIDQTIDEGSDTIHQLLDTRAIWQDGIKPDLQHVELERIIKNTVDKICYKAETKKISIKICAPTQAISLLSDVYYLGRCIENLLDNAVKFSYIGGSIFVSWFILDQEVHIEIEDQGPGIKKSERSRLFRRFQRLSPRPTGGESSVGLGLAVAKGIAESLGGSLRYKEAAERGAVFKIILPYQVSEHQNKAEGKKPALNTCNWQVVKKGLSADSPKELNSNS